MGDSGILVVQASTSMVDISNSYRSTHYGDISFNSNAEKSHIDPTLDVQYGSNHTSDGGGNISTESIENLDSNPMAVRDANGNVNSPTEVQVATSDQQCEYALCTEDGRLWSIVKTNSLDFDAWTSLIEEIERVARDNIIKIRKVYDSFLAKFPLCYGYWKKYADHEARFGDVNKVVEIYERAVQRVTYSVDIWLYYCGFTVTAFGDPNTIRRLFERALVYVGTDYLSYPLWDKYIEYEYTQQQWANLAMIFTRILENPNQQLDRYLTSFKELATSRPLSELKVVEETVNSDTNVQGSEFSEPTGDGLTDCEQLEKYIVIREEIYKKAKEFDSKIVGFESAIRRPYFHVQPLSDAEIENWHSYLDLIEREGDFNKVLEFS